jgi:hypothetical protein
MNDFVKFSDCDAANNPDFKGDRTSAHDDKSAVTNEIVASRAPLKRCARQRYRRQRDPGDRNRYGLRVE